MIATESQVEAEPKAAPADPLAAFYADRPLMWRNIVFISVLSFGWAAAFTYINPLMQLQLKSAGVSDSTLGLISGTNSWIYSYLVMYFAWKSDHTVSRWGRRIPFLLISSPVIIGAILLFPLFEAASILIGLYMLKAIFMDIKAATIPLLNIDCVPRHFLARVNAINAIVLSLTAFLALRYGMGLADHHRTTPYLVGAAVVIITSVVGVMYIKEPPVLLRPRGRFLPWSAMKIAWTDRRMILLMVGVGLLQATGTLYNAWIWLYADQKLGLSRGQLGEMMAWGVLVPVVVSYPAGWLIDRYRGMRMVVCYWLLTLVTNAWLVTQIHSAATLVIGAMIAASLGPFYTAADIKVYRDANRADVGSITSTSSCVRGIILGITVAVSGLLIQFFHGDYRVAFLFGAVITSLGFFCILLYSRLAKAPHIELSALAANPQV